MMRRLTFSGMAITGACRPAGEGAAILPGFLKVFLPVFLTALLVPASARACPFCSAVSLTFAQEIAQSEAAVIARLVEPPPAAAFGPAAEGPLPKASFEVVEVLKGHDFVATAGHLGDDPQPIETVMIEEQPVGTTFLLMAIQLPTPTWSSPIRVGERGVEYLRKLGDLPEKGPERLAFFLGHLEDDDDTLTRDAYDEFAVAPYDDVRALEDRMDPSRLLGWIEDPEIPATRRRLYATMLGICGTPADGERIAAILEGTGLAAKQPEIRNGLDALIACYVALAGPPGLDLVDRLFLDRDPPEPRAKEVPFTETYAAVMALRFLGEESDLVPRERVLASLKLLLDDPKLADLVIADLARWQDWSEIDRLATMFKEAASDNLFVREPIVNYLRACPLPEAAATVAELEKIDPKAVARATAMAGLAGIAGASPPAEGGEAPPPAPTPAAPQAEDPELAGRIDPVIGDEDPAIGPPARSPTPPAPAGPATAAGRGWSGWRIAALAAALAVAALAATALARPRGAAAGGEPTHLSGR